MAVTCLVFLEVGMGWGSIFGRVLNKVCEDEQGERSVSLKII